MKKIAKLTGVVAVCVAFTFGLQAGNAEFVVTIQNQAGGSQMGVRPGDSFTLSVNLENPNAAERFDYFHVEVLFSHPGLLLDSYDFPASELVAGGSYDFSSPPLSSLPVLLSPGLFPLRPPPRMSVMPWARGRSSRWI